MATVTITDEALAELAETPAPIRFRIQAIVADRLVNWPAVSGAKALRGALAGNWRIRTGDYRIVFRVSADGQQVVIWKIGHRGGVYD